jgi:uncharacterized protein YbaR (Trm112 family)
LTVNEITPLVTEGCAHRARLEVLICPVCSAGLKVAASGGALVCPSCRREVALRRGIPRFVSALGATAARTQASFGYEWSHFDDWTVSGDTNFQQYFGDLDLSRLKDARVLDYSLGVLHHLQDTDSALSGLVRLVRPGGRLRVYLYWQPGGWRENVLALVSLFRRVTTRLPFGVLRALCWILSVGLWTGVIVPYRILRRLGIRGVAALPLFQYTMYPFVILYNDQFDRFSAPLEKRYHLEEDRDLLEAAGLVDVRVWPRHG